MKKVLLIVVDACASRVLMPAIESGKLPNIAALKLAGSLNLKCSSIFPSITPAATSSIVTGCYPKEHGIPGAYWYDTEKDQPVYYGADFWVIMNKGIDKFFKDFLMKLNHQRLQADTLFQTVEKSGLNAASLNYIIYRGNKPHKFHIPWLFRLLSLLPGVSFPREVYGPSLLCLGDFVCSGLAKDKDNKAKKKNGGALNSFGLDDEHTAELLIELAKNHALPDFTLAYFPDNDFRSHEVGPENAVTALVKVDDKLGEMFAVSGGMERMLEEFCIVLTGDHSQTDIFDDEEKASIRLDKVLADFNLADAGEPWDSDDQLMICPNMRAAQIYFRHPVERQIEKVIGELLSDTRVDQVMWCAELTEQKESGYRVATQDRGVLHFQQGSDGSRSALDEQGCEWKWSGDLETVDGKLSDNKITFPDYPNAFERIACALDCKDSGHLWITAKPGYEFRIPRTEIYVGGGSHGSLHVLDSTVPLLVAGAPDHIKLPEHPRTVDVEPLCLSILGLKSRRPVGTSHVKDKHN